MTSKIDPKWRTYEKLVAKVQQDLAPDASIKHDDQIWGYDSKKNRQIDVSVRQQIGQYNLLIAMDCKDYAIPVDIGEVESFATKIRDIRANKGAMVASNGFTEGALTMGQSHSIDLYRLIDAEVHDWQAYVSIPVLCDFRSLDKFRFAIPDYFPDKDPYTLMIYDTSNNHLGNLAELLHKQWNSGKLPSEPGESVWFRLTDSNVKVKAGGEFTEIEIRANIIVKSRLHFGQLKLIDIKGFRDEQDGTILTNGFTTDWLNAKTVEREWREISSIDEIAVMPLLTLTALDIYNIPLERRD